MKRRTKYTLELLTKHVHKVTSWRQLAISLGLKPSAGNEQALKHRTTILNIDITHFRGKAWASGYTADTHSSVAKVTKQIRYSNEEVFCLMSPMTSGTKLTQRLLKLGWTYTCRECGTNTWKNQPLRLHLDHINGNRTDNRFTNLRFLCPNCHQQTDTWGHRKVVTATGVAPALSSV
jgi:hypothetical protein